MRTTPTFAIASAVLFGSAFAQSLANYRLYAYPTQGEYAGKLSEVKVFSDEDGTTEVLEVTPDFDCELADCGSQFVFSPEHEAHIRVSEEYPEFHGLLYQLDPLEDSLDESESIYGLGSGLRKQEMNEGMVGVQTEAVSTSTSTKTGMMEATNTPRYGDYPMIQRNGTTIADRNGTMLPVTNGTHVTSTSASTKTGSSVSEKTESAKPEKSGSSVMSSDVAPEPTTSSKETPEERAEDKENAAESVSEKSAKALGITLLLGIVVLGWF
ncbi:hypothetical protein EDC01DRAFT_632739 [Geopyxis carbonaria]|nr:hypothetical protein EDC01DRAFT_632739 [Geopyxis carbonaria]